MNQLNIVQYYNLQIGDKLVREKGIFSKHHGVYAGIHNGVPLVAENQIYKGVGYVSLYDFLRGDANNLVRVERFVGNTYQRSQVIPYVNSLLGTSYDLINFNCEHFAELVQKGHSKSTQVENAAIAAGLLLLFGIAISL